MNSPGTVTFEDLIESMSSVINKAGGLTDFASLESSYILRDEELINFNFKNLNTRKAFLMDNDIVIINGKYEEINISGAVNNPSKSIYEKGISARKYVRLSGGKVPKVGGRPFVIYPSGKAKKIGFFNNTKVYPGCEVFVPFVEPREPFLDRFAGGINTGIDRILQFSTLATATLTTIFLVKNLKD